MRRHQTTEGQHVRRYLRPLEALPLYHKALELWSNDAKNFKEISRILTRESGRLIWPQIVRKWVLGLAHPLRKCNVFRKGADLAYVLTSWMGDGRLARCKSRSKNPDYYNYYVRLQVKSYEFASEFGKRLARALGRPPYKPKWDKKHKMWDVYCRSILLYQFLKKAKEEDSRIIWPYIKDYPVEACRGFFDAEGSVSVNNHIVQASNYDLRLLEMIRDLLKMLGIKAQMRRNSINRRKIRASQDHIWSLEIRRKENILKFAYKIGFSIPEKQAKLMELVQRYKRSFISIGGANARQCAKALIAAHLVKLNLVESQSMAARMLSVSNSAVNRHFKRKTVVGRKILDNPTLIRLSIDYLNSQNKKQIIDKVVEFLASYEED